MRRAARGFFPLDERWELTESVYSPELAKQMVWLAATRAYPDAAETFARIARRVLPISSIWDETQRHTVNGSRPMSSSSKPKWEWSGWSCPRLAKIMTGRWG